MDIIALKISYLFDYELINSKSLAGEQE